MKMKPVSAAVAAGLGLGLMSSAALAVYVNPDGLGQVLIYPYYTAESTANDGFTTNFQIVNTSDTAKVVKVRFLEAMNSQEVLDFNLYLSAHDEWTGAVVPTSDGAALMSNDNSCTSPTLPTPPNNVAFRNVQYSGDSVNGLDRTREGYLELISMGNVVPNSDLEAAITHNSSGVPADCGYLSSTSDSVIASQITTPTGGLYGYGTIVNVMRGTAATYDATALAAFTTGPDYHAPGSVLPSLTDATPQATVFDGSTATVHNLAFPGSSTPGADAVSATMMASNLVNDYVVDPSINAGTDWVVTFPTKRFYVNGFTDSSNNPIAMPPFTTPWDPTTSTACEPISITYYDREEQPNTTLDFSPQQGGGVSLCYEANVITFNGSDVLASQFTKYDLNTKFDAGWMNIDLANDPSHAISATDQSLGPVLLHGLPAIGFADIQFTNGDVGGLLSNYAGITAHKLVRSITSAPQ